jgi:hypothetical protein
VGLLSSNNTGLFNLKENQMSELTTEQVLHYWEVVRSDHLNFSLFSLSNQVLVEATIKKLQKLKELEDKNE